MKPVVSIIIAVYNAEKYIARCLESIIHQTYKEIEIICVNDASTDDSQIIIDKYKERDNRIISIIHKQNMNAGGAMNHGIKAAKGEYVCIVDNDDWLADDAIELLVAASDNLRMDMVTCDWYAYRDADHYSSHKNLTDSTDITENVNYSLLNGYRILGALIRRSIFVDNDLFFPERVFYEDNAIGIVILCYAKSVRPVHNIYYYYYLSPGSVTRSVSMKKITDKIVTTDLFLSNLYDRGFVNESNKELVNYRFLLYTYNTLLMITHIDSKEANGILNIISEKVKDKIPNKYLIELNPKTAKALSSPIIYYRKRRIINKLISFVPDSIKQLIKKI